MPALRIAVCVPSYNVWTAPFGVSLSHLLVHFAMGEHPERPDIRVFNAHGCVLPEVRTLLVADALKWGASHILFLDSDMRFPPDALLMLLRHRALVVGANYVRRGLPTFPTAYLPGGRTGRDGVLWTEPGDAGLVEVQHVATGVMLIDVRAFDCIDFPWFDFEAPSVPGEGWRTDDVYFCRKLRRAGIPVYCDQALSQEIGHVGEMIYTHAMGLECRRQEMRAALTGGSHANHLPASSPESEG